LFLDASGGGTRSRIVVTSDESRQNYNAAGCDWKKETLKQCKRGCAR
jgi:hypothetical protein